MCILYMQTPITQWYLPRNAVYNQVERYAMRVVPVIAAETDSSPREAGAGRKAGSFSAQTESAPREYRKRLGQRTCIKPARTLEMGSFSASAMYARRGLWPTMEEYVSRWIFVFHSQLVVSGWPVPMYLAWSRSSSCWVRSLSA